MEITTAQLAGLLGGNLEGPGDGILSGLGKISEAKEREVTFLTNPAYTPYIYTTGATATIVRQDFIPESPLQTALIRVADPEASLMKLLHLYNSMQQEEPGISGRASISEKAVIGDNIYAGDFAVVEAGARIGNGVKLYPQVYVGKGAVIGDNSTLYAGVKIYAGMVVGKGCILHSGVVIGADGFRFVPGQAGDTKVPQIGNVVIGDEVEMGANCAVDRATLGSTVIGNGVKFDNFVHIAHNCEIGDRTYIAASTVVAGSVKIGKDCMFSGQIAVDGHLSIADGTIVTGQSGVSKSVTKNGVVLTGSPAFDAKKFRRSYIHFRNLEAIVARVEALESKR